jgi:hypothetical protein
MNAGRSAGSRHGDCRSMAISADVFCSMGFYARSRGIFETLLEQLVTALIHTHNIYLIDIAIFCLLFLGLPPH